MKTCSRKKSYKETAVQYKCILFLSQLGKGRVQFHNNKTLIHEPSEMVFCLSLVTCHLNFNRIQARGDIQR